MSASTVTGRERANRLPIIASTGSQTAQKRAVWLRVTAGPMRAVAWFRAFAWFVLALLLLEFAEDIARFLRVKVPSKPRKSLKPHSQPAVFVVCCFLDNAGSGLEKRPHAPARRLWDVGQAEK